MENKYDFMKRIGHKGREKLAIIGSLKPYIDAMDTEPWKEIFEIDVDQLADIFNKVYDSLINNGCAEQKDVIKMQVIDEKLRKIYEKWKTYNECISNKI